MDQNEWIVEELERVFQNSRDYKQKALIAATQQLIKEEALRVTQMEGELDGTLWSPRNWSE
ncbi:hypothetical protein [Desemzia sp. FAM 24101]|uniref:hypothetical protein n=1 Tax=unclassified Desemzia TaxID=2685243 RepID=UPI0038856F57